MAYVTSIERYGRRQGRKEGIKNTAQNLLLIKFGKETTLPMDLDSLEENSLNLICERIITAGTMEEVFHGISASANTPS